MAKSPTRMMAEVSGDLILRTKDGSEYHLGAITADLPISIHYVPSTPSTDSEGNEP